MDPIQDPFLHHLDDKDLIVASASELVSLYFTNSKISLSQQGLNFSRFEATYAFITFISTRNVSKALLNQDNDSVSASQQLLFLLFLILLFQVILQISYINVPIFSIATRESKTFY